MRPVMTHVALHVRDLDASIEFYRDFCRMEIVHERRDEAGDGRVVWLAEPGRSHELIFVLMNGGVAEHQAERDYGHLGFALERRDDVDAVAAKARDAGRLAWEPVEEPYPVGYYCGVRAPNGNVVEFSFGQPLGPGAESDPAARERPSP